VLQVNFTGGIPFPLNSLNDLLDYFEMGWAAVLLDILYVLEIGEIDIADAIRNPSEDGLRPLVEQLVAVIDILILALDIYL